MNTFNEPSISLFSVFAKIHKNVFELMGLTDSFEITPVSYVMFYVGDCVIE